MTSEAMGAPRRPTRAAAFAAVYVGVPLFGFVLFAALMKSGVLAPVQILFYRGLVAIALSALVLFLLVGWVARRVASSASAGATRGAPACLPRR